MIPNIQIKREDIGVEQDTVSPLSPEVPRLEQESRGSKAYFQNDNNEPPVRNWPTESKHIWSLTPLRGFLIMFDVILASSPIMFIGKALI